LLSELLVPCFLSVFDDFLDSPVAVCLVLGVSSLPAVSVTSLLVLVCVVVPLSGRLPTAVCSSQYTVLADTAAAVDADNDVVDDAVLDTDCDNVLFGSATCRTS